MYTTTSPSFSAHAQPDDQPHHPPGRNSHQCAAASSHPQQVADPGSSLSVRPDHKMNGHTGFLVTARLMNGPSLDRKRRPAPGAYGEDYHGPGGVSETE